MEKINIDKVITLANNSPTRFWEMIDRVPNVVFEANAEGLIAFVNFAWVDYANFDLQDTLNKPLLDFVHKDDRYDLQIKFSAALSGDALEKRQVRFMQKSGDFRSVEIVMRSWSNLGRAKKRVLGTITDISE